MLHAVDTRTGEVRWEVPLGSSLDLTKVPIPWQWGSVNLGGPVIGGGLVFIAASMDRRIRAFDLATGALAWEHALPASGQATPLTYRARPGGRQFLVIAAGGHGGLRSSLGDAVVAFALPARAGSSEAGS
jgi:quinoprotein glucose dehydrogenase